MKIIDFIHSNRYLQISLLAVGVSIFAISSYQILNLPLWGNWPLLWLLGIWSIVVGAFWKRLNKTLAHSSRFALSTLSGILLALSFPVSPLTPLIFIGLVPLLILHYQNGQLSFGRFFGHLFNSFFLWNAITTFWVLNTSFMPGIVANVINAALMTLPWIVFKLGNQRFSLRTSIWGLVAFWIAFEYLHLQWQISWPWLTLGHTFAARPSWIQWYSLTGVFGGAAWIWLVNVMIFNGFVKNDWNKKSLFKIGLIVLVPIVVSALMYVSYEEKGKKAEVVIVQPNYEPHYEKFEIPEREQIAKMVSLSESTVTENTKYLLLPETVISGVKLNNVYHNRGIRTFIELADKYPQLNLVTGISSFRTYPKDSLFTLATRIHVNSRNDSTFWDVQNNAIWIAQSEIQEMYFKSKLVPGAEIFPYRQYLPFLKPIIDQLGGSVEGHARQKEREAFGPQGYKSAPVICYESVYGEYVGDYVKAGAEAIFIMTNDGWWDVTPGHLQHLHFARLRAIEQRKSVARAANTGISCFINPKGDIIKPTLYGQEAAIKHEISFNSERTFYNQYGDYIAWAAIAYALFFILGALVPRYYLDQPAKDRSTVR